MRKSKIIRLTTFFIGFFLFLLLVRNQLDTPSDQKSDSPALDVEEKAIKEVNNQEENLPKLPEANVVEEVNVKEKIDDVQKFDVSNVNKIDYHDYKQIELDKTRQGAGEQGTGVRLGPEDAKKAKAIFNVNGFNGLVSDKISLHRSISDIRHHDCMNKKYVKNLPSVSIIIPFHEEHWSTLLRTFISAIDRAPKGVIKDIILVDDFSTKEFLKKQLEDYIESNYKDIVKVVRTSKREGLIRTRLIGAKAAKGDVLIFLDSHCECNINWLPPLLEPIALNYTTVTCPFIDVIAYDTFEYHAQDEGARGAFNWEFLYKRLPRLPEDSKHPADPFESPIMAGGLFAISTKWFWELGGYDTGLDIWGGEQYELSFKLWQCGGRMVDIPCSRIGHIYRKYAPFSNPGIGDFLGRNFKRIAEVWMDEYKEYLYMRRPSYYKNIDPLDITEQQAIREKLKCRSFKWFMTNVAFDLPKHYPPIEPGRMAEGEVHNVASKQCLNLRHGEHTVDLNGCVKEGKGDGKSGVQEFILTWRQELRPKGQENCLDYADTDLGPVTLYPCHLMSGNQFWKYNTDTQQLIHPSSNKCMDARVERREVFMNRCNSAEETQKWTFTKVNVTFINANYHG